MHKLVIDTDPGVDDAQAIAFAIAHPDIELLGLTSVFGNATLEITTRNALTLLERFGRPDIPVASGASQPLVRERMPAPDFVHGTDGLGNLNLPAPTGSALDESAAEFIVRLANEQPGEISIVAVGPLTNLAQAVKLDPGLASKVKELIVMGGTIDEPGNVTPVAEANFINDPHAADRVLAYDWPVTLIGLDVTHRIVLRDRHTAELRDHAKETGQLIWDSSRFYVGFYMSRPGILEQKTGDQQESCEPERTCAMHDASAIVYLVEPDAFKLTKGPARVVDEGIAIGQLTLDRKGGPYVLSHWDDRPDTHVAISVDAERVLSTFLKTLIQHSIV